MVTELQNDGYDEDFDLGNNPPLPTPVSIERSPQYAYRDHSLNYRKSQPWIYSSSSSSSFVYFIQNI